MMDCNATLVDRNLQLLHAFNVMVLDNPSIAEHLPIGATVVLIPSDDPELTEYNLGLAVESARRKEAVVIIPIELLVDDQQQREPTIVLASGFGDTKQMIEPT